MSRHGWFSQGPYGGLRVAVLSRVCGILGDRGVTDLQGLLVRGCVLAGESFFERIKNQYACMYVQFTWVL
jgi:hypothetical protein